MGQGASNFNDDGEVNANFMDQQLSIFCESFSESFTTRLHCKRPNPDSMETCVDKNVEMIENPLSKHIGSDLNRKQSVEAYLQKNLSKRKTKMMV